MCARNGPSRQPANIHANSISTHSYSNRIYVFYIDKYASLMFKRPSCLSKHRRCDCYELWVPYAHVADLWPAEHRANNISRHRNVRGQPHQHWLAHRSIATQILNASSLSTRINVGFFEMATDILDRYHEHLLLSPTTPNTLAASGMYARSVRHNHLWIVLEMLLCNRNCYVFVWQLMPENN